MSGRIDLKRAEQISKAIGDPYRLKIMEAIRKENDWMQCSAVTGMFDIAQSTVSHHVNQLVDAELLHAQKEGRHARYKINKEVFSEYIRFLKNFEL